MKNRTNKDRHEINRDFHKFQRWDTPQQKEELAEDIRDELSLSMMDEDARLEANRQCALATFSVLKEEFGAMCTMKVIKFWGFFKIHMMRNDIQRKSTSQIEVTITKDNRFNIHLNPYGENYDKFYYHGDKLNTRELMAELRSFKSFLYNHSMSENTKLTKEKYYGPAAT